jgi:zinc D-Ala-D-Ala carboxypeptidase
MEISAVQTLLGHNGFPCGAADGVLGPQTRAAVTRFQQAFNGPGAPLAPDGAPGPLTQAAMGNLPRLSAHFTVAELACHHCGLCYVRRELLAGLEWLRGVIGPVPIVDAYRCAQHNHDVGGATDSMHLYGYAADPNIGAEVDIVQGVRAFSGIGDKNGVVKHVDLRHLSPANQTPTANPANPARWHY